MRSGISKEAALGRDQGPMSTRNCSRGALLGDVRGVIGAVAAGEDATSIKRRSLEGKLLHQRTFHTRRANWNAIYWRYLAWNPPGWVVRDLGDSSALDASHSNFRLLAYLHFARRDRLTYEFLTSKLWSMSQAGSVQVRFDDVFDFLAEIESASPEVRRWRESSRRKLAGNLLSALRDFGFLKGTARKTIQTQAVPRDVVLHLVRLLHSEGLRGRTLMESRDWRLFLWEQPQVAGALAELAHWGQIRFEKSGRTVVLELLEDYGSPSGDAK